MKNIADLPTESHLGDPEGLSFEGTVETVPVTDEVEGI